MTCFIVFVELTLTANNISGVYTLNTTGQLIPFIIGITSMVAAMREIALRYIREVRLVATLLSTSSLSRNHSYFHSNTLTIPWYL